MNFELIESPEERRERIAKAIEFAGQYARSFDRALLQYWYTAIVQHTLPPHASHVELAADNAVRAFVVGIIRQYQLATTGSPDTPWALTPPIPPPQPPPTPPRKARRRQRKTS